MSFSDVRPPFSKPPMPADPSPSTARYLAASDSAPIFLREIASWPCESQDLLFRVLLPVTTLVEHGIDPISLTDSEKRPVARLRRGATGQSLRLEVFPAGDASDPMMELELSDTLFNQIEVVWVALQDPDAPRFDIDMMPEGEPTLRGVARRNLAAEQSALEAGLAPGQIRRGFSAFSELGERLEAFMYCLNQREYVAQPLFYHTAVLFERIGFTYIQGQAKMEEIAQGFAPKGELVGRLDGSTPFRQPKLAETVRGRSWAIHDGILGQPWDRVRMVKRLGVRIGVDTCPGVPW